MKLLLQLKIEFMVIELFCLLLFIQQIIVQILVHIVDLEVQMQN